MGMQQVTAGATAHDGWSSCTATARRLPDIQTALSALCVT
jgi:hypothetical protein